MLDQYIIDIAKKLWNDGMSYYTSINNVLYSHDIYINNYPKIGIDLKIDITEHTTIVVYYMFNNVLYSLTHIDCIIVQNDILDNKIYYYMFDKSYHTELMFNIKSALKRYDVIQSILYI